MNNKITAIAVAAALAAPMAVQAAPKVYGIGQVEFAQTSNSSTSIQDQDLVVDNKFGRFGIKGSEDLGGGLKALYTFEFGIETSNSVPGANTIFERETSIGLKIGKQHEIRMGAIKSPYKYMGGVKYDSFVATSLQAREGSSNIIDKDNTSQKAVLSGGAMSPGAYGQGGFLQNSFSYMGKFKPVRVWLAYSPDEELTINSGGNSNAGQTRANSSAGAVTVLGVDAKVGSFHFGYATITKDGCDDQAANSLCSATNVATAQEVDEVTSSKIFGSWSMGQHTVRAQIENKEVTRGRASASGTATETDYTYLNYQFKMGKHLIDVVLGEKDDKRATAGADKDFTRLAYAYNFSKKTRVFAGIAESDATNNDGTSGANDWDTFSVGMTVKF